jgi:hypothetical protein
VFVLGVARCGSTLLGRLLDRHPRVAALGEFMRLDRALVRGRPCSCGARVEACPAWGPELAWIEAATGYDHRRFTPGFYARVARARSAEVVVDLSKTMTLELMRRWRATRPPGAEAAGFLLLVRDSRGVLASSARRGKDVRRLIGKHKRWMNRLYRFAQAQDERTLVVHYEDLCRAPEPEIVRICRWIGIDYVPEMLRPAATGHHLVHASTSDWLAGHDGVVPDERWKSELAPELVARIERTMQRLEVFRGA